MLNLIRIVEAFFRRLVLYGQDSKDFVQKLNVMYEEFDGVVRHELPQLRQHLVGVLEGQLLRLLHAKYEIYDVHGAKLVGDELDI